MNNHLSAVFFYLSREYSLKEGRHPSFIPGRTADVIYNGKRIGIIGEIHPEILENWGIEMPCAAGEIDLDFLIE